MWVAEEEVGCGRKGGGGSFAAANTGFLLVEGGWKSRERAVGEINEDLRVISKCFIRNFFTVVI